MKQVICLLLLPLSVAAQKGSKIKKTTPAAPVAKGWSLTGMLTGLPDNSTINLISSDGTNTTLATTTVKKSKFVLKATLPQTAVYLLNTTNPPQNIPLFMGNEAVKLSGDVNKPDAIKVTGSPTHTDFMYYSKRMQPLLEINNTINQLAGSRGVTDSLRTAFQLNTQAILAEADNFLQAKPGSPVSPLLLLVVRQFSPMPEYTEQRYNQLTADAKASYYGKILGDGFAAEKTGPNPIGSVAPDFSQADTAGNAISLSSFKGKYVLIDFWASWCRPCRDENPNVVANFEKFKNKNFTVLGVSLDRAKEPWLMAIQNDNLKWTHISDLKFWSNAVAQQYSISSIPQNLLIDPDGKIVAKNLRGDALGNMLCKILGCN